MQRLGDIERKPAFHTMEEIRRVGFGSGSAVTANESHKKMHPVSHEAGATRHVLANRRENMETTWTALFQVNLAGNLPVTTITLSDTRKYGGHERDNHG
jgi:hypothetical protein